MKIFSNIFWLCTAITAVGSVCAATVELVPSKSVVHPGDSFTVSLLVSDLDADAPSTVGDYDFILRYEPTILTIDGFDDGLGLGAPDEVVTDFDASTLGIIRLAAVSLLSPTELDAFQPSTFNLSVLNFSAANPGTTALDFMQARIDDAFAQPLVVSVHGAVITVVPLPSVAISTALMLCMLYRLRWRRSASAVPDSSTRGVVHEPSNRQHNLRHHRVTNRQLPRRQFA